MLVYTVVILGLFVFSSLIIWFINLEFATGHFFLNPRLKLNIENKTSKDSYLQPANWWRVFYFVCFSFAKIEIPKQ